MLSKNLIKLINSLKQKKYRQKYGLFLVEGQKIINDLIALNVSIEKIVTYNNDIRFDDTEIIRCKEQDLNKISFLKTAPDIVALVKIPDVVLDENEIVNNLSLALDGIQDPGNLGTIIRIANWFGIKNILCSNDCVDIYNPKVVQATMGALFGVKVHYIDLSEKLREYNQSYNIAVYGTFMQGQSIYSTKLQSNGIIVMGSEGQGISPEIEKLITNKITIPSFAEGFNGAESLNVGVATGIVVSEFVKQKLETRN